MLELQFLDEKEEIWIFLVDILVWCVFYCVNVGDVWGVLCCGGKVVCLMYDYKGLDKQEVKCIVDVGGFVMSGWVNGVLVVIWVLGDLVMKEYVVGVLYMIEMELSEEDEFFILVCDGVCCFVFICYDEINWCCVMYDVSYGMLLMIRRLWILCV